MTKPTRREEEEAAYAEHLTRSQRQWDRWSDWYALSESDFAPMREALINTLDLTGGDRVLDIGCGPGVNFAPIRSDIGPSGELIGLDYSPEMVDRANARVEANRWDNVRVVRGDATTADLGGPYDAAIATLSLSIMPDVSKVLENVHGALKPDSYLGVLDIRPIPTGPGRIMNPLIWRFLRWYANWNPDANVNQALTDTFAHTEQLETHFLDTIFVSKATRM